MKPRPYGPFPYSPIVSRPKFELPNGARIAVWVIPNVEFFSLQDPIEPGSRVPAPDVSRWSQRDYGNRIGIFRMMEVLDRYGVRATVALNSDLCAQHPFIIEQGMARGWEWMGHNNTNTVRLNDVPEREREIVASTFATIGAATGTRPVGWLGSGLQETWNTLDLLSDQGCEYVCDWINDDQPYEMTLDDGRRLISLPYGHEVNDKPAYERLHATPRQFRDIITWTFDTLYREGEQSGRVLGIALHPYLSGVPHRIRALDEALEHICKHPGVWLATGSEIARHYRAALP